MVLSAVDNFDFCILKTDEKLSADQMRLLGGRGIRDNGSFHVALKVRSW